MLYCCLVLPQWLWLSLLWAHAAVAQLPFDARPIQFQQDDAADGEACPSLLDLEDPRPESEDISGT